MNIRHSMKQDAQEIAALIIADLGIQPGKTDIWDSVNMSERTGGSAYLNPHCNNVEGCCYDNGTIWVSNVCTNEEISTVLVHELAHRLCFSERYEHLNSELASKNYPRLLFLEYIARAVETHFIRAGGYTVEHKHTLETYPFV